MRFSSSAPATDITDRAARQLGVTSDSWLDHLRNGRAFFRGPQVVAGAAQVPETQLFNPAGSLKTVIVYTIWFEAATVPGTLSLRLHNVALATLVGNGFNLVNGGAASVAEVRSAIPAALDGTEMAQLFTQSDGYIPMLRPWLYQLGANQGLIVARAQANTVQSNVIYWVEI